MSVFVRGALPAGAAAFGSADWAPPPGTTCCRFLGESAQLRVHALIRGLKWSGIPFLVFGGCSRHGGGDVQWVRQTALSQWLHVGG